MREADPIDGVLGAMSDDDFLDALGPPDREVRRGQDPVPSAPKDLRYLWLSQLAGDPSFLEPPRSVVPRLALEGRVTLLAAEEKAGKSTLVGQGVAAVTAGLPFLGKGTRPGPALWLAYDEPLSDCAARLVNSGADQNNVALVEERLPWDEMAGVVAEVDPVVLVVDTLTEWAVSQIDDLNSAHQWTPVLARLRHLCRERGMAAILLHHTTKGGNKYADSRAIGAGVDIIIEMARDREVEDLRYVSFRGRGVGHGKFRLRYGRDNVYRMESNEWT